MCGIAGIMTIDGSAPQPRILDAMQTALNHRGPDGHGQYFKNDTSFGQTRLAIIDLVTGDQPFTEPGGATLIANGEVYNYLELRQSMKGAIFTTQSDCEVPLHLYRQHGIGFAAMLRGMYAIAIHDAPQERLILARDPFGIKPLYYAETSEGFGFASEPQALIRSGIANAKIKSSARDELLQLKYTTGRETIFAGINRVLPGETLVVSKGRIIERRRIDALPNGKITTEIDEDRARDQFDRIWADSIRVHQRADVPYGMFLSGGIDSSAILAMMARINNRPVKTFTIGFSGTNVTDERAHARAIADAVGTDHVELEFGEEDFWRYATQAAAVIDDPIADYAALPTLKLAAAARSEGLKVILSGEGGDELFGGYGRYRRAMRPPWLGGGPRLRGALDKLGILRRENSSWRKKERESFSDIKRADLSRLQAAQATDCAEWLPNDLLVKLDRCLMKYGIEGRTPFLDPKVAEFSFLLPDALKVKNGLGKWLLRTWLQENLPVAAPFTKKRGFTVPVGEWINRRGTQLGELVSGQECIKELCYTDEVVNLFRHANENKAGMAAWALLFYALWYHCNINGQPLSENIFDALEGGISYQNSWRFARKYG